MQEQMLAQKKDEGQSFVEKFLQKCLELLAIFVGNPLLDSSTDEKALFERLVLQNIMARQNLMLTDAVARGMNPIRSPRAAEEKVQEAQKGRYAQLREQIMKRMSDAPVVVPAPVYEQIALAAKKIAQEIKQGCGGDAKLEVKVLNEYLGELERQQWKTHDLMSPLLLILEKKQEGNAPGYDAGDSPAGALIVGQETAHAQGKPDYDAATPGSAASRLVQLQVQAGALELAKESPAIAQIISAKNADAAEIRIIAVREMLRHYFEKNPKEFREIAISLLGMVPHEGDEALMQRIAYEMARIGSIAFAYRMLLEIQKKKKIGEAACLRTLAVQKGRGKKVYVCPNACPRGGMARGILELLIKKGGTSI